MIVKETSLLHNILTALQQVDRVLNVRISATCSELEMISTVMQEPFPALMSLLMLSEDGNAPVLPTDFLGGSAPCLQFINSYGIPYPALPTLLLSTSDLVTLHLRNIPPTGYISPEKMVVGLAALPKLNTFVIEFQSASPRPNILHRPPATRIVLPILTTFQFQGTSEYLEDLASRIDAPQIGQISIRYLNQLVDFQVAQLSRFIHRSVGPKSTLPKYARVGFQRRRVTFDMSHETDQYPKQLSTTIICQGIDWQVSHMAQVLSQFSTTLSLSAAVHLKLGVETEWVCPTEEMDDVDLRHLLLQFSTMQTLHVSRELAEHVARALEHMVPGAFAFLDFIFLEGQPASSVEKFLSARKFSDRPVIVVDTEMEFDERVKSYISK